jgi:hypothetical protein
MRTDDTVPAPRASFPGSAGLDGHGAEEHFGVHPLDEPIVVGVARGGVAVALVPSRAL